MEWYNYLLLIGVGVIAGFINTLAGSGSLLTLPVLMFLGLPPNVANGTNRIAILFQSVIATRELNKQKIFSLKDGIILGIPTVVGSILGANIALIFNDLLMKRIIGGLLIVMLILILIKPEIWIKGRVEKVTEKSKIINIIIFFFIGIYGGFIQAGVGLFLLAGLVMGYGCNLLKANGLKNFIVLLYTPFALLIFILNNQVDWLMGVILAVGSMGGAYVATKVAIKKGTVFVRYILIVALLASSLKLIGVF